MGITDLCLLFSPPPFFCGIIKAEFKAPQTLPLCLSLSWSVVRQSNGREVYLLLNSIYRAWFVFQNLRDIWLFFAWWQDGQGGARDFLLVGDHCTFLIRAKYGSFYCIFFIKPWFVHSFCKSMSLLLTFSYITSTSRWPYNACLSRRSKPPYGGSHSKWSVLDSCISKTTLGWTRPTMPLSWVAEKQDHQVCESSVRLLSLLSRIGQATANLPALCRFTATQKLYKSIIDLPASSDCFSLRNTYRLQST